MEYTKLGNTGMDVSRICLGCMGFGNAEHLVHKWVLNEENSRPIIKKALELGINFFDTANCCARSHRRSRRRSSGLRSDGSAQSHESHGPALERQVLVLAHTFKSYKSVSTISKEDQETWRDCSTSPGLPPTVPARLKVVLSTE